jgi:3-dehydroquinate synthase
MMPDPHIETLNIAIPGSSYPVHLGQGLLRQRSMWKDILPPGKLLLVSDDTVAGHYLGPVMEALDDRQADVVLIPEGESQKSFESWRTILDRLVEIEALRDSCLVALGGGVIGDLTGFAAAAYMRGVRFIQVPTTLLAQVDASVGGKTAINHPAGKNLVGAFHQPCAVLVDLDTLATLPKRAFNAGMAEVVKYGAIRDPEFFSWLEEHREEIVDRNPEVLLSMIARSVRNKAEVVAEDEKESGIRAILNFGHSFGHALEALGGYTQFLHGEAVSVGMVIAASLSEIRGICPDGTTQKIRNLLSAFSLPVEWPAEVSAETAVATMALDKKALDSGMRLILLQKLGSAVIDQGSERHDILQAIESNTARPS